VTEVETGVAESGRGMAAPDRLWLNLLLLKNLGGVGGRPKKIRGYKTFGRPAGINAGAERVFSMISP
jgi:hypothetical protein